MKMINEDVIHVDPDVIIFDRLFDKFYDDEVDMLVQHIHIPEKNFLLSFVHDYYDFLIENKILNPKSYDNRSQCTGVFGLKKRVSQKYYDAVDILYNEFKNNGMSARWIYHNPIIVEELTSYLISNYNQMKVHDILPYNLIESVGEWNAGNVMKYTHLWLGTRFQKNVISLVKNKILTEFPKYYHCVENFETHLQNTLSPDIINEMKTIYI